jgi:glutaredoxin
MDAREAYSKQDFSLRYVDVKVDSRGLGEMLQLNGGVRQVPTIVEDGKVTIGFGGT